MKNLLTVGTSHMTDMHYDQSWHNDDLKNAYVHYDKGELRWTEYLAKKLKWDLVDLSIGSYGINTYTQRIYAGAEIAHVALVEIPDYNRYEIFLNKTTTEQSLQRQFWATDEHKKYIYKYTSGDYNENHSALPKFKYVNENTDLPLTKKVVNNAIELTAYDNQRFLEDKIWSTISMIDGYLYSKNIKTFWFSWNYPIYAYDYQNLKGTLIMDSPLNKNYSSDQIPDGAHLKSSLWKELVDDLFIPKMRL